MGSEPQTADSKDDNSISHLFSVSLKTIDHLY